jgi:hypothetical protein
VRDNGYTIILENRTSIKQRVRCKVYIERWLDLKLISLSKSLSKRNTKKEVMLCQGNQCRRASIFIKRNIFSKE